MDNIFFISDLHFGHARVIEFDNRPFSNVEEMDKQLIANWNAVVGKRDTVYVLGDFIWKKEQLWPTILEQLKGNIVLIRGNHDPNSFSKNTKSYFIDIKEYKEIDYKDKRIILCHYPIPFYRNDINENVYMLYGHVHTTLEYEYLEKLKNDVIDSLKGPKGNFINVGCMMPYMSYAPKTLEQIIGDK